MVRPHNNIPHPELPYKRIRQLTHALILTTVGQRDIWNALKGNDADRHVKWLVQRFPSLNSFLFPKIGGRPRQDQFQYVIGLILDDWYKHTKSKPTASRREPDGDLPPYNDCMQFVMDTMSSIKFELQTDTTPESHQLAREINPDMLYRCIQNVIKIDKFRWK